MRNLDFSLLRTFVAIVDNETFAGAASSVHRTQSAVSQQMQRLETLVGRSLMVKHGRTKRLTEDGQTLLDYARRIINLNDELLDLLDARSKDAKVVRVGACHDMADTMLPLIVSRMTRYHANLVPEIHTGRSPTLMEMLNTRQLDLVVSTRLDPNHPKIMLRRSPTVWICAGDYAIDRRKPLPLVLSNEPSLFRQLAINALERQHISWRMAYLSLNLDAIRAAVRAGLGITARNIETLTSDMRVLGEGEGLPKLPTVPFYLYMNNETNDDATRRVFEAFRSIDAS